ncbi:MULTISPECIES: hypothetical protein [Pseudomonas]|uniref:Uncharacterized protein n=1 Tax=Pseudomonas nitroreducens TaxID=46680 RepID=A0A6G6J869_PSENT|nr:MULTISPECIES: hypothetical protein [Pseudomonas]MDU4254114.1 hypothetical protein [Pseudomonas sp.]QIE91529.1 hypothetical protein G5B91_34940 [Pseudomonas nitroreducens]
MKHTQIHTPEAKAFLVDGSTWPATINTSLPHFLAKASGMLFSCKGKQEVRVAEGQLLPKIEHARNQVLRQLRPFLFTDPTGLFNGMDAVPAYDESLVIAEQVLPAVDLLVDFDIFVGLTRLYPGLVSDAAAIRTDLANQIARSFNGVHKSVRTMNSGRAQPSG